MLVLESGQGKEKSSAHSNPAYSTEEYEEWGRIGADLMKRLGDSYNDERIVSINPSTIYLGLNFGHHYANTLSGQTCDEIRTIAERLRIPVKRMQVQDNSFDLFTADVVRGAHWSQL